MIRSLIRRLDADERGIALPVVLGLGLVMLLLVSAALESVTGGVRKTSTDEDMAGARSAAYAGVEEYQSRLANDSTYYKFGNPNAAFSASSKALLSLPTGTNANPAFNISASQPWAKIPGSTDASYRYEVDISDYGNKGIVRLRSTGKVGSSVVSLVADLRQSGFIDFLYFTSYEELDPAFNAKYRTTLPQPCDAFLWASPTRPSDCSQRIQFGQFDELHGPVHSNDTLDICGATFDGTVTTSNPTAAYDVPNGCPAATFKVSKPVYEKSLDMPPTNSQMKKETRNDLPADVPNPGCLYTGPTSITFTSDGNMRVVSPYTKVTQTTANAAGADISGTTPAKCGKISDLQSTAGAVIPVLDLNLVFVQNVPSVSTDPNYWASNKTPTGFSCLSFGGVSNAGWSFGTTRYPLANEVTPSTSTTDTPAYGCRNGDLFVSGTEHGRTTIAAYNYVYVTGNITYADPSNDILGIVGQNAIWVWNPITKSGSGWSTSYAYGAPGPNRTIDAAMLSVAHTLQVQNYDANGTGLGNRGTLTILGAIAQKYRGTVATSNGSGGVATGYAKDYQYDTRLRYTAPPKFLTPVSTTYGVTQYSGVKAAYNADGSPAP
ncbi:hypothetical protein ACFPJ4_11000 [Lysinimonas soli]|uniref:Flp pilus-assembly TadG-like N-terminal domain-containing protein n=1 Tax=Lysinimonas soli TaxID=1074233 RepID=A0ABW0NS40_9MICO